MKDPAKSNGPASRAWLKKRRAGAHGAAASGVSVYRSAAVLFLLSACLLLAGIWLAHLAAGQERRAFLDRETAAVTEVVAAALGMAVAREQAQLAVLVSDPALVNAAVTTGHLALGSFPGAERVAVLPRGFSAADPGADPPMGYALLDMLRRGEGSAESVPPEVHRSGEVWSLVNFVQPLILDGRVAANLVVSYPSDWLQRKLLLPGLQDGRLRLEQVDSDGQSSEVFAVGNTGAAAAMHRTLVAGTPWRVQYVSAAPERMFEPLQDPLFLSVAGGSLLLLATMIWLVFAALARRLAADGRVWQSIVMDTARRRLKLDYPVRLHELRRPLEAMLADLSAMAQADPTGKAGAASWQAEPEAVDPRDAARDAARDADTAADGRDLTGQSVARRTEPDLMDSLSGLVVDEDSTQPASFVTHKESPMIHVDRTLFRAYDIRGVVGKGLSEDVVCVIGHAIGSEAAARGQATVVVGRDGRLSSPALAAALVQGLRAAGREVIDIGQVPTPVMYFATYHLQTGSGVMVTGSHNPPDYNGLKIMLGGETLSGDAIAALHQRIVDSDFASGEGSLRQRDVVPDYLARVLGDVTLHRPMKVVVDCGNGVAGEIAPQLLRDLGCEVQELYCEIDGTFPNHHPDPSDPANLQVLIREVRESGADVGLAFDGDGDRLGVVDSSGKIIWPDRQMMLYAMDVLARAPGSDIIFDVKCSSHLARIITENAGVPVMWRTGHSLIKAKLKETGAPLAGEMSGHIFFNDRWDGFDDGLYTAARLLEILAVDDRSSTAIFAELPETVSTPELKIQLQEGEPPELIRKLVGRAQFPDARLTTIDGLRVDFPDGWGLVRASNTTPCLVLRFEADDQAGLERIQQAFRELLDQVRPGLNTDFQ